MWRPFSQRDLYSARADIRRLTAEVKTKDALIMGLQRELRMARSKRDRVAHLESLCAAPAGDDEDVSMKRRCLREGEQTGAMCRVCHPINVLNDV